MRGGEGTKAFAIIERLILGQALALCRLVNQLGGQHTLQGAVAGALKGYGDFFGRSLLQCKIETIELCIELGKGVGLDVQQINTRVVGEHLFADSFADLAKRRRLIVLNEKGVTARRPMQAAAASFARQLGHSARGLSSLRCRRANCCSSSCWRLSVWIDCMAREFFRSLNDLRQVLFVGKPVPAVQTQCQRRTGQG